MSHVSPWSLSDNTPMFASFPATHSILAADALCSEILASHYNLGSQIKCLFLLRGVNDTYLVQTATEQYILRIYRTSWRTVSDILYEIDVLMHLEREDIPVSLPVARTDGSFIHTLQAPEGPRHLVLFTYAPGVPLNRHGATDSYYHGRALANIHNATDTFSSTHVRADLDFTQLIDQSLQVIQPLYTGSAADWAYLQDLTVRLRSHIQQLVLQGLDWGVCHGDSHMLNDHIGEDQTITFFDFDCCATGWRAYDLAVVRWCEGFYDMDPEDTLWHAFLKGYTERRTLAENDLVSIASFVALREIWHTALVAWLQPDSGVQGFDKVVQRTLRLLRKWEMTSLKW